MNLRWIRLASVFAVASFAGHAAAQDMMSGIDLTSDAFTKAEMSRADLEAQLAKLPAGEVLDLSARSLNGLDLSKMDLRRTKLQSARINRVNLAGANLEGVVLDQAWALDANMTGIKLKGASLFATQLRGAKLDGADFTGARVAGDFTNASMVAA
ncbi:MAG: pentapeptide repeat-containing protein, partial [Hyphomicrobium sp.]